MLQMKSYEVISQEFGSPAEVRAYYMFYLTYGTPKEKAAAPIEMLKNKKAFFNNVIRKHCGGVSREWKRVLQDSEKIYYQLSLGSKQLA